MTLSAQCVVKNEERWIWFSLTSIIDYVDTIDIVDTGSTDTTIEIIKSIKSPKIKLTLTTINNKEEFTQIRQDQLTRCKSDWLLILDGDEIWTKQSIDDSLLTIKNSPHLDYLVNKYTNFVGDVYHYQPDNASGYVFGNTIGPFTIRFINRKINGLHWENPYGSEGLSDSANIQLQDTQLKYFFINSPYLHCTHLMRSSLSNTVILRNNKFKYEIGDKFNKTFIYPKPFYLPYPALVRSPWTKPGLSYWFWAGVVTPFKKFKRSFNHA